MKQLVVMGTLMALTLTTLGESIMQRDTVTRHRKVRTLPLRKRPGHDTSRIDTIHPRNLKKDTAL